MARVPSSLNNSDTAVNRNIDSSLYDNVKIVADSIDDVVVVSDDLALGVNSKTKIVAEHIVSVDTVSDNINSVVNVSNNISAVNNFNTFSDELQVLIPIANDITNVSAIDDAVVVVSNNTLDIQNVSSISNEVVTVSGISSSVSNVSQYTTEIVSVDANQSNINIVSGINTGITSVANNISKVTTVANNINAVNTVSSISSAVTNVSFNSGKVDIVASNISKVALVSDTMPVIQDVAANITNIQAVCSNEVEIDLVAGNVVDVNTVASNISSINNVSSISNRVTIVSDVAPILPTIVNNINMLDNIENNLPEIGNINTHLPAISNLDLNMNSIIIDATNIGDINTIGNDLNLGGWASIKDNGSITDVVTVEPQGVSVIKNVSDHMTDITNITANLTLIQEAPANAISASNSATSALASKNLAEKWASELEDVVVADGKYSSYHWAQKSADLFTNGVSLNNLTDVDTTGVMQGGIIRYDETTGWKVFDFSHSDKIGFNLTGTAVSTGEVSWNPNEGTLDVGLINGSVLQIGQENIRLVRNDTGVTITNGTVCMYAGTIGSSGRVKVTPYTGVKGTEMYVYGVATQDITNGSDGYVTIEGKVRGIDTTGSSVGETWVDGDVLYAKPNDNGALTKIMPSSNEIKVEVASVIKAHSNGTLEVRVLPIDRNYSYTKTESDMTFVPRVGDFNLDLGGL